MSKYNTKHNLDLTEYEAAQANQNTHTEKANHAKTKILAEDYFHSRT